MKLSAKILESKDKATNDCNLYSLISEKYEPIEPTEEKTKGLYSLISDKYKLDNKSEEKCAKPKELYSLISSKYTTNCKQQSSKTRVGFSEGLLDEYSFYTNNLKDFGFSVPNRVGGRIFESTTSDCSIARLDSWVTLNGKKQRYLQTEGKGQRFFKHFIADVNNTEVVITEGIYDAFAAFACGKNAIAYAGILGAFDKYKLHLDLKNLTTGYEIITLGFDIDKNTEQQLFVERQIYLLAKEFKKLDKEVFIIDIWANGYGKDFSEVLANRGVEKLISILNSKSYVSDWLGISATYDYSPTITEATEFINPDYIVELLTKCNDLFIKAPMGAGKTYSLGYILNAFQDLGVLIISPLRVLGRQIVKDLREQNINIDYRDDISPKDNWEKIVCCLESISTQGKLKIKVDGSQMINKILVIDEAPAVIENLLEGNTISKRRKEVVDLLTNLLRSASKRIYLSADLTDYHCDVIKKIVGVDDTEICKYANVFLRNKFTGYHLENIESALELALNLLADNKKVFIAVDSKNVTGKYSTSNLPELLKFADKHFKLQNVPEELILVLDSDTTKTKGHDAFKIVVEGKIELLSKYKVIIASPSIQSGFSLKAEIYSPDAIILLHTGTTPPDGICQLSMRIRDLSVPRYFAFGGYPELSLSAGGAVSKGQAKKYYTKQVKEIEKATNVKNKNLIYENSKLADLLNLSINLNLEDLNLSDDFYRLKAIKNLQILNRENYIFNKLKSQGATIYNSDNREFKQLSNELPIKQTLNKIRSERIIEESEKEFKAPNISNKELNQYKEQLALTKIQQNSVSKYFLQTKLKHNDLAKEDFIDNKYGLLEDEELLYWFTEGRNFAEFQQQEKLLQLQGLPIYNCTKLLEDTNTSSIYRQDAIHKAFIHKVTLLEKLGLLNALNYVTTNGILDLFLIGTDKQKNNPQPIIDFIEAIREEKKYFCNTFEWSYKDFNCQDTVLFNKVLKLIGYKFSGKRRIRAKLNNTVTKQITVYSKIESTRNVKSRKKRFTAYTNFVTDKYNKFVQTQLFVTIGRELIENKVTKELINKYKIDELLEASKRLPRKEYGLSKHSQILMHINGFEVNTDIPIEIVTPENVNNFTKVINNWITNKTEIGFDTETYESAVHKAHCFIENDKWYWHNPQTNKNQRVKPGLDQNNNQVRLIQFSDGDITYVVDLGKNDAPALPLWFKDAWIAIDKLTRQNTIVGHNLKFDTSSIKKYGLTIKKPYCTMIATKLLHGDCGAGKVMQGGYGLKSCIFNLLNLPVDKSEQMSNWGAKTLTDSQIIYAAKDAVLTLILKKRLDLIFNAPKKWGFAEFENEQGLHANLQLLGVENRNIYHTTEMQWRGVPCDIKALRECIAKLEKIRSDVEQDWKALQMPCNPKQAPSIVKELNKRYIDKEHPFEPQELAESLGINLDNPDLELPEITENFTGTSKDVINDNPNIPELLVLKAWRSFNTAITQLSKVLLSVEINGSCKTEYKVLSGTGRMSCGNEYGLGTPNLQAFMKSAKGKFYGFIKDTKSTPLKFWDKPSIEETIPIRELFKLTDKSKAFFTEDANASHSRLAVGFGKCEFGKSVLEDENMDAHSMFSMMALQVLLTEDDTCLDGFSEIRNFVKDLSEAEIRTAKVAKNFKNLDADKAGKRFRDAAKTLFYSVLNGAQADKMRKVLSGTIGQSVSVSAGEAMFNKFWGLYQGIGSYIKQMLAEAEANEINYGGIAFNLTTLPDGVKLLYARKNGDLATTNLIACQWSRSEATALKNIMASVEQMPEKWGANLINMVHDEVGIVCNSQHWQDAYKFTSESFASEYDAYLNGFVPSDQPTELKLHEKLFKVVRPHPEVKQENVTVGDTIRHYIEDKGQVKIDEPRKVNVIKYGKFWSSPNEPYVPTSWADK